MKTIMKTLLVSIASFSLMFSANAGDLAVSGTAKATYNAASGTQGENGIGVTNELNFKASGEMDNGYAWSYRLELDPSTGSAAGGETAGAAIADDAEIALTMNDMGTLKVCVSECSTSNKYAWDNSAYTVMTDTGFSEGIVYPTNEMSYASIQYHSPELPFSGKVSASYGNKKTDGQSGNTQGPAGGESIEAYAVSAVPVEGLTAKVTYMKERQYADGSPDDQLNEGGGWSLNYAYGNATIGYGRTYVAPTDTTAARVGTTTVEHYKNRGMSLGYAVNDNLSVSYTKEVSEASMQTSATTTYDVEADSIQAAYSLGGATLSIARADYENVGYVQNADRHETIIAMSFAF
jgi:hypothetical protein